MNTRTLLRSTLVRSAVALVFTASLATGCVVEPGVDDEETTEDREMEASTVRRVLLCEQGLSDRVTEWDKGLFDLCEAAEAGGLDLIRDGKYPAFGALDQHGAYDALFDYLDSNDDGLVTGADAPTNVRLVGFSWGGINVTDIAWWLQRDERIIPSRRGVSVMVLLDPYQPHLWHATIPSNVARVWEYAQSNTTEGDCSTTASLGSGFNGLTPRIKGAGSYCAYYDLDRFKGSVGHCDVPVTATKAALVNLLDRKDYGPWAKYEEGC
jgi:hypothetical protein